jgi:glycosyltransferase involved in cell wall biosynthesis
MLKDAAAGEVEVIVVCNGCEDDTEEIALSFGGDVRVIAIENQSKIQALNLGDSTATYFPRFYLDADVEIKVEAIRAVADLLEEGKVLAAAPRLVPDLSRSPWMVRAYFSIWLQIHYVVDNHIGSGVFALSKEGRARFVDFPDVVNDDMFVRNLFSSGERVCLTSHSFVIHAPTRVADLVRRKSRVARGNRQLGKLVPHVAYRPEAPGWYHVVLGRPSLAPAGMAYLVISAVARLRAVLVSWSGREMWERDSSSRPPLHRRK